MANTFTGLKLQGQIGKFGAKELSDIEGQYCFNVRKRSGCIADTYMLFFVKVRKL